MRPIEYQAERAVYDELSRCRDNTTRLEYKRITDKLCKTVQMQYDFASDEESYKSLMEQVDKESTGYCSTTLNKVQVGNLLKFIIEFVQKDPAKYYDTGEVVAILEDYKDELTYQLMGVHL